MYLFLRQYFVVVFVFFLAWNERKSIRRQAGATPKTDQFENQIGKSCIFVCVCFWHFRWPLISNEPVLDDGPPIDKQCKERKKKKKGKTNVYIELCVSFVILKGTLNVFQMFGKSMIYSLLKFEFFFFFLFIPILFQQVA